MENLYQLYKKSSGVSTDSRAIQKDSLFIALKGENFDGNNYVKEAINDGAKYAITSDKNLSDDRTIFYVPNTLLFLQELANHHRKQFDIPIIGITGSNGKTTTKELIAAVLSSTFNVLFTKGNLNNHIGVPLTLLNLNDSHEIAIIEMGANKPGDIKELVEIAEPTHGIITNIGRAHLEGFGSLEGVIRTKTELYEFVKHTNGKLFYNSEDEILSQKIGNYSHTSTYSSEGNGIINGTLLALTPFVEFSWSSPTFQSERIQTQLVGKYNFYNFLAAVCIGVEFNVSNENISKALQSYTPTNNRSQIEKTATNTLILDAYNANPTSVQSALDSFDIIENEHKTVILGDMLELGKDSDAEHLKIIAYLSPKKWNKFLVGPLYKNLVQDSSFIAFDNTDELKLYLEHHPLTNQLILIKGSRGIKLETVVQSL